MGHLDAGMFHSCVLSNGDLLPVQRGYHPEMCGDKVTSGSTVQPGGTWGVLAQDPQVGIGHPPREVDTDNVPGGTEGGGNF